MFRNPTTDLIVVLVIVLLIFGPKRLPGLGKQLGQGLRSSRIDHRRFDSDEDESESRRRSPARALLRSPRPAIRAVAEPAPASAQPYASRLSAAPSRVTKDARMAKVLRPIGHEDRLSIVDHLDELRSRLIICGIALAIAFGGLLLAEPRAAERCSTGPCRRPRDSANHISGLTADQVKEPKDVAADRRGRQRPGGVARSQTRERPDQLLPARLSEPQAAAEGAAQVDTAETAADHDRRRRAVHDHADGRRRTSRCCSRCRCSSTRRTRS